MHSILGYLHGLTAECDGCIPVERFMQEALYHPIIGYYARRVQTVGRQGDFSTSATLHPALGEAIGAWAARHRAEVKSNGQWHLIELGGGGGELAAAVLGALGWWARRGLRYHLVEISAGLRAAQERRLQGFKCMEWHDCIQSALAAADGRALIFSNEFVDAFPCLQLVWNEQFARWDQVGVGWNAESDSPTECFRPWAASDDTRAVCSALDEEPSSPWKNGQRIELHLSYRQWLTQCAAVLRAGRMLTIDYGERLPALYYRQPRGTLRAYCRHQRFDGLEIYRWFGQQDLTADVNFTDLERWGEEVGLANVSFDNQADFLRRWLPARRLKQAKTDAALAFMLDPAGPGGAFKALEQQRSPTAGISLM